MSNLAAKEISKETEQNSGIPSWVWYVSGAVVVTAGVAFVLFGGGDQDLKKAKAKKAKKAETGKKVSDQNKVLAKDNPAKKKVVVENLDDDDIEDIKDPLEKALAAKNKGNKYFRGGKYDSAIKCYTQAIETCPLEKKQDLSTFYQNRAAAHDQMNDLESTLADCEKALELNSRYVKAMERRAKVCRKQAEKSDDTQESIEKLKSALEDITSVCLLEGFQKQENLLLVDTILKQLGRAEAKFLAKNREPLLTSKHFIQQYVISFAEDPVFKQLENLHSDTEESSLDNSLTGFSRALSALKNERYDEVVPACNAELDSEDSNKKAEALVLRATFYVLSKRQEAAFTDLDKVIEDEDANVDIRVNALIKRASLYIQRCKDPQKDPDLSFGDFARAEKLNSNNADIYHHRGQVYLLTDQIDKAIADFSKAVELRPDFPIAYVQKLYTLYRKAQQTENASEVKTVENCFEEALEKFPKCVETYALYAQVCSDMNKFDRADDLYEQALKIDPGNANIYVHRGLIALQSKGDIEKSMKLIQKALEIDEKSEFAYETLGTIEVQRGNLKAAIDLFEKAIPLANTELEMAHLFGLKDAAGAQLRVTEKLGMPTMPGMGMM